MQSRLDLDKLVFYGITSGDPDGIPAVELDITSNEYNILLFTSEEAANLYCLRKSPENVSNIYRLEKRNLGDKVLQASLVRITRVCKLRYPQITGIIFDHPGHINNKVNYCSMSEIITAMNTVAPKKEMSISDFVSKVQEDDSEEE